MLHTAIFIGRSGCGKGTQAELLKKYISSIDTENREVLSVETGERLRNFIRGDSFSSKLANDIYQKDELSPGFMGCWLWGSLLIEQLEENMHIIFDGVARSLEEAKILTTALEFYRREQPSVIYLNVSRKWSEERLLVRNRMDDVNLEKIDKRLNWFDDSVLPALDYFKSTPFYRFIEINGEQSIEKVHSDIVSAYGG